MWRRFDKVRTTPLSMVEPGREVTIVEIRAGKGLQQRLLSMGLIPGERVKVLNNWGRGPFLLQVKGTRIALGYGVVHKILVI
ncbi:MAG: hypothetical protein DRG31_04905 [Deltaproteobacteria bacterium]|nr:MAG: hypothetical protein DRG31_04905 [Deltaproteobacteria bacterium]